MAGVNFLWKRVFGQQVMNISSSSGDVRAYGFSGKAPSAFYATECGSGQLQQQLLLINVGDDENATVALPEHHKGHASKSQVHATSSYAAWVLTPPTATGGKSMSACLQMISLSLSHSHSQGSKQSKTQS